MNSIINEKYNTAFYSHSLHTQQNLPNAERSEDLLIDFYYGDGPDCFDQQTDIRNLRKGLIRSWVQKNKFDILLNTNKALDLENSISTFFEVGENLRPSFIIANNMATYLIDQFGSEAQQKKYCEKINLGELAFSVGYEARNSWYNTSVKIHSAPIGNQFRLDGEVAFVLDVDLADYILIPAQSESGLTQYFIISCDQPGVKLVQQKSVDPSFPLANLHLDNVVVDAANSLRPLGANESIDQHYSLYTLLGTAQLAGVAQGACTKTILHAKIRKIDGGPIARYQSLSHRMVDMYIRSEKAKSLLEFATLAFSRYKNDPQSLGMILSMAKTSAEKAAQINSQEAIQIHGAEGFQWKHPMNFYFRRALLGKTLWGKTKDHNRQIAKRVLSPRESKIDQAHFDLAPLASLDLQLNK